MKKATITAEQDDIMGVKTQGTIFSQYKVICIEEWDIPLEGEPLMTAETNDNLLNQKI